MNTKMTFTELLNKHQTLMSVSDKVLPRKVAVAIARNIGKMENEVQLHYKQRADIADRFAVKDDAGNFVLDNGNYTFKTKKDNKAFLDEINQLNEAEIDIEIMTFDEVELERCEMVERYDILTPREEATLSWMIKYE